MGSSKAPKAPPAPDPYAVAGAQTGSNVTTAVANSWLGNANVKGPLGSVTNTQQTRKVTVKDPKTGKPVIDPKTGKPKMQTQGVTKTVTDPTTGKSYQVPIFQQEIKLDPAQQKLLDQQNKLGGQLNDMAINQSQKLAQHLNTPINLDGLSAMPDGVSDISTNGLPELKGLNADGLPDITQDMGDYRKQVEEGLMSRMNPQLERDYSSLENRLINQGLTRGSEAFTRAMDEYGRKANDARTQIFLASGNESRAESAEQRARREQLFGERSAISNDTRANRGQLFNEKIGVNNDARQNRALDMGIRERELQERMLMRNQPINEITALMNGGQVSIPQFGQFNPGTVAPTPVGDYIYQTAGLQRQDAQTAGQQNAALWNTAGNIAGGLFKLSDERTKTDLRYVYTDAKGYEWFMFRYWGWDIPSFGVMAQQVLEINPAAVGIDPETGFFMVNYGAL